MKGGIGLCGIFRWIVGLLLLATGVVLLIGGARLLSLGGSAYYVLAGVACTASAVLLLKRSRLSFWIFAAFLAATAVWSVWEVGFDFWQLLPRLCGPAVVGVVLALVPLGKRKATHPADRHDPGRTARFADLGVSLASFVLLIAAALAGGDEGEAAVRGSGATVASAPGDTGWTAYGADAGGLRHSGAAQITPANVTSLEQAWAFETGVSNAKRPDIKGTVSFMATPIMVEDRLVFCEPTGAVVALNPDTGKRIWRRDPGIDPGDAQMLNCRGVSYHKAADAAEGTCSSRIINAAIDGRLMATDVRTGAPCPGFGAEGEISLREGLGDFTPYHSYTSSPPAIVGDTAILGGYVLDNVSSKDVSGVVRAYDVNTGELLWAWDSGRAPDDQGIEDGKGWTPSSPNAWSVFSADPELGLVFLPMGNATPDAVGTHRTPDLERYASSIVALDVETGLPRWHFQTVHHDLWDFDVPAQPVLFDMPTGSGTTPAVAVPTKQGQIFVLDRRTGEPLTGIEERPVPQGDLPGETYSPTQPYVTGFPSFEPADLTEKGMWGTTPLDQMWCRIRFRSMDYEGPYTPPSLRGSIQWPGIFGILNWGSVSIDPARGIMIVNTSAVPQQVRLFPRSGEDGTRETGTHAAGYLPQEGTDYGVSLLPLISPLGLPCHAPPWGHISAIDLKTRELAWQRPLGTTEDVAPLGISVPGVFNLGGSATTASGLVFIGAAIDDYLRAFDIESGREVWRGRLPAGGQATPMTYVSEKTGKQYVVIAAGGHGFLGSKVGDSVVAFALPD